MRVIRVVLAMLALAGVMASTQRASLKAADGPGRILSASGVAFGGLTMINLDGTNTFNITPNTFDNASGGPRTKDDHATMAANGVIAFESNRDGTGTRIFVVNRDGTGLRQVTTSSGAAIHPIHGTPAADHSPVIAPDGTQVAFLSQRFSNTMPSPGGQLDVFVVNVDGTNLRRVSVSTTVGHTTTTTRAIAWSPDSRKLVFRGFRFTPSFFDVLGTIDVETQTETIITPTHDCGGGYGLDWASTGDILYTYGGAVQGCPQQTASVHIWTETAFKSHLPVEVLGSTSGNRGTFRFSPDGTRIVYYEYLGGTQTAMRTIGVDGTAKSTVTSGNLATSPLWWAPGAAFGAPTTLAVTPNPLRLFINGPAIQVATVLRDATGNVLSYGGTAWDVDSRYVSLSNTGLLQATSTQPRTLQLCASNGGILTCVPLHLVHPTMSTTPTALAFAATRDTGTGTITHATGAQTVTVAVDGPVGSWSATTTDAWMQVTSATGSGAGQFSVALVPGQVPAGVSTLTGTVTMTAATATNSPQTVAVTLNLLETTATTPPVGRVDTPTQGSTGMQGAIAMTGWVVDDVGIQRVRIYRQCLGLDHPLACQTVSGISVVFVGDASIVAGARPDVEAAFPSLPASNAAGWGFLILSNMLPNITAGTPTGGVGTFHLYAVALDAEGHEKVLGRLASNSTPTTVTVANDTIAKPFGTIDTPGQGATVSGLLHNFGWVLTPDTATHAGRTTAGDHGPMMPIDGSTISVFVDGAPVGTAQYNLCRGTVGNPVPAGVFCDDDVSRLFRGDGTRYRNLDAARGAIGLRSIDTTTLSNGLHTISWGVTDSSNRVEGIGSRYFTVLNSGTTERRDSGTSETRDPGTQGLRDPGTLIWSRTGFDLNASFTPLEVNAERVPQVRIPELGRVELQIPGVRDGALIARGEVRGLPVGVGIDRARGVVTWAAGPGYLGTYRLRFELAAPSSVDFVWVDVTVAPASNVEQRIRMRVDRADVYGATFTLHGWALDPQAATGSGIGTVHVWGQRKTGAEAPVFLGVAQLGVARPDVAAAHGAHVPHAGFVLHGVLPDAGDWDVTAYVWVTRTGRFEDARTVTVRR